ncbi:carbohydrate ABC transporter permease [Caldicellulosiruptoraceae bacterium PP1]
MKYKTKGDKIFDIFNGIIMIIILILTFYPFWYCLIGSLNTGSDYMRGGVYFLPRVFTLANYKAVFANEGLVQAFIVSIGRTVIGTFFHLVVTGMFAYAFSRNYLKGKNLYATLGIITMYFGGGLIPTYLNMKMLGLIDNFLVYILPNLFSFWDVLILQTSFKEIPDSIIESAKIDGAGEYTIFFKLIVPLSLPVFAVIALFHAVFQWNSFFDAMLYTNSDYLQPIQYLLMKIIRNREAAVNVVSQFESLYRSRQEEVNSTTLQLATMIVATIPILCVYPFIQKYFVKGVMVGSIKG